MLHAAMGTPGGGGGGVQTAEGGGGAETGGGGGGSTASLRVGTQGWIHDLSIGGRLLSHTFQAQVFNP